MTTHYEVLGVEPDATHEEIKKAFQRHQRRNHPDVAGPGYEDEFIAGSQAGAVLLDDEARAAYDEALANPAPLPEDIVDEPIDAWVSESVDMDVAVDEPEPEATRVDLSKDQTPDPQGPTRVTNFGPDALLTCVAAIVATMATSLLIDSGTSASTQMGVGVVGLVAGLVLGWRSGMSSQRRIMITTLAAAISMAAAAAVAIIVARFFVPARLDVLELLAPAIIGGLTGAVSGFTLAYKRRDAMFLKTKDVLASSWFGAGLPGELPAYLEREIASAATVHMRIFRLADAPFSHLLVSGDTVYLLRNITGSDGSYYFSGPSLLFESHSGELSQVVAGDFTGFRTSLSAALGRKIIVRAAITVMADHVNSPETDVQVIALHDLRSFLDERVDYVNRSVMIDSVIAAAQVSGS